MSSYKNGSIVFFRNDSAYSFVLNAENRIEKITPCPELMGLGIDGTFAYDAKNNKIYFSKLGDSEKNDLFEATWKDNAWTDVEQMQIRGVMKQRQPYKNSSLVISRYVQTGRGASGFYNPSLGKNGKRVYFSGEFKAGKGGRDIWYTDLEDDGLWSRPKLVSENNSSDVNEDYPLVVGDTILFFASNRPGGAGGMDIYYAKKSAKDTVWGEAVPACEYINSSAEDYNVVFGKEAGTAAFISNREGGHGLDDIYAALALHVAPDVELVADQMLDEPRGFNWVFFFFDLNKFDMKPEYEVQLDEVIAAMAEYPGAKFEISGHTDSRGDDNYNQKLSQKRAEFVRNLLIKRGVDANSLVAVGKGELEPIIANAETEEQHEQNRRVELSIIEEEE
jgi:flagellar motor protein MotB